MYGPKIAGAVVISNNINHLLVGQQGTANQGKLLVSGYSKAIQYELISAFDRVNYAAAVLGTTTIPVPSGNTSGEKLIIRLVGLFPENVETEESCFINASVGENETLSQAQWGARIVAAVNNNIKAKQLFIASYNTGVVTFTQVSAGNGKVFVESSVSTIVTTLVSAGSAQRGYTGAQLIALRNDANKGYPMIEHGTIGANDTYHEFSIVYGNNTFMNPFGFKENKPETLLVIVKSDLTTVISGLVNLISMAGALTSSDFTDFVWDSDDPGNISGRVTRTGHGYSTGDRLLLTAYTGGANPIVGRVYTINVIDANNFDVFYNGVQVIPATTDGTASFRRTGLREGDYLVTAGIGMLAKEYVV